MNVEGLLVLLKVHHWFGFGPLKIEEKIGDFFVEEIKHRWSLGSLEAPVVSYTLRKNSLFSVRKVERIRGNFIYNIVDNFATRYRICCNYFNQPFYEKRSGQRNSQTI